MNTRFDGQLWIGAFGVTLEVKEMETGNLLNTVKMLLQKPARVQAMLVADIENATFAEPPGVDRQPQGGHPQGVCPQHHQPLR